MTEFWGKHISHLYLIKKCSKTLIIILRPHLVMGSVLSLTHIRFGFD